MKSSQESLGERGLGDSANSHVKRSRDIQEGEDQNMASVETTGDLLSRFSQGRR